MYVPRKRMHTARRSDRRYGRPKPAREARRRLDIDGAPRPAQRASDRPLPTKWLRTSGHPDSRPRAISPASGATFQEKTPTEAGVQNAFGTPDTNAGWRALEWSYWSRRSGSGESILPPCCTPLRYARSAKRADRGGFLRLWSGGGN
jgi:hypothetical protein